MYFIIICLCNAAIQLSTVSLAYRKWWNNLLSLQVSKTLIIYLKTVYIQILCTVVLINVITHLHCSLNNVITDCKPGTSNDAIIAIYRLYSTTYLMMELFKHFQVRYVRKLRFLLGPRLHVIIPGLFYYNIYHSTATQTKLRVINPA